MTTPDKLLIVQTQNRVIGVQEFRVEDDLDSVGSPVEELHSSNLVQDRVVCIICHVVCDNGWKGVSLQGEYSSFEEDLVFSG